MLSRIDLLAALTGHDRQAQARTYSRGHEAARRMGAMADEGRGRGVWAIRTKVFTPRLASG